MTDEKINLGLVGLGKMGISHLAIANAHPKINLSGVYDSTPLLSNVLQKNTGIRAFNSYEEMLSNEALDCVLIATPSRLHGDMVQSALAHDKDIFCEKPFVLDINQGKELLELAQLKERVTQVGYHYRFVGTFEKTAELVKEGLLGRVHHAHVEAYGPVVTKSSGSTWRTSNKAGGGALYDYACHAIDLLNFILSTPDSVDGVVMNSIFSKETDDEVYCNFLYSAGLSASLSTCWSDPSYRKMSTSITLSGTNGKIIADRQELQIYLNDAGHDQSGQFTSGWNTENVTSLTPETWYYLRGEEYSRQIDYFVDSVLTRRTDGTNSFASALETDLLVDEIRHYRPNARATPRTPGPDSSWLSVALNKLGKRHAR